MDIVADYTAACRSEEGNLFFEWSRSVDDPHEFVLVEAFTDEGAAAHVQSPHFQQGIDAMLPTVAGLARAAATSEIVKELVARPHWREMYVAAPVGGVMVEGYVDLLADDGAGGLVVLDYKTDSVTSEAQVAERTERYRLQAATYALALEEVAGRLGMQVAMVFVARSKVKRMLREQVRKLERDP